MKAIVRSPAKLNLFLAVTGRRGDGYHELVSVVSLLGFGDELSVEHAPAGETRLSCDDPAVPTGPDNLILKAAAAFRERTGWGGGASFQLTKRIPIGAGLGGGSSNAAAALVLLNRLASASLPTAELARLSATVGSDCALFFAGGPAVMRGRGETVDPLPEAGRARLRGRKVLVFKPGFPIATAWGYDKLAEAGGYLAAEQAQDRLSNWLQRGNAPVEELLFNDLERPAFGKFPALPALLSRLQARFGLRGRMSGSGSACFVVLPERGGPVPAEIAAEILRDWGESAWMIETALDASWP